MRVNDPNTAGISSSGLGQTQRLDETAARRQVESARTQANHEDRVQLSSLAGTLQELSVDSPEREELVEQLAAEYREGRYRPDPRETSSALITETLKQNEI
jgi:anti-sigma28 factor (negative regulator of flagellin synthesis)